MFDHPTIEKITEETPSGLYRIDHEAYHASPGISSSDLKNALISYGYYITKKKSDESTPALEFGKAFHMAILEPRLFEQTYVIEEKDKFNKRTKQGREDYQDWLEDLKIEGKEIIKEADKGLVESMAASVHSHPKWKQIKGAYAELACVSNLDGLIRKCKMDVMADAIVDFKTCRTPVTPGLFMNAVNQYGYHISGAHYQDVVYSVTAKRLPFIIVAVEKFEPFGCAFYELSDELLEIGRELAKQGEKRILKWMKNPPTCHYGYGIHVLRPNGVTHYKKEETMKMLEAQA